MVGIDPGLTVTGYGLIALEGNRLRHVEHGVWRRGPGVDGGQRLAELGDRLEAYLARHRPSAVAIEQAFLGKNVQSTLRLGEARGALIVACVRQGLVPIEFPAATVKKAITGNGRAAKEQVQYMVAKLLALPRQPEPADAADALAVAMTLALDWRFSPANRAELRERGS
ncbi:MAG: crossover junction endodeoxyribonuclease RuvC [Planctomycetes bacterium]|nr:crossover junction endodeoxyribonuclease RuvC [Planctomycetota bacterium]